MVRVRWRVLGFVTRCGRVGAPWDGAPVLQLAAVPWEGGRRRLLHGHPHQYQREGVEWRCAGEHRVRGEKWKEAAVLLLSAR
jgi:hypothetical protein